MDKPRVWLSPWSIHSKKAARCGLHVNSPSLLKKSLSSLWSVDAKKGICSAYQEQRLCFQWSLYAALGMNSSGTEHLSWILTSEKHSSKQDIWPLPCNHLDTAIKTAQPALGAFQDGRRSLEAPKWRMIFESLSAKGVTCLSPGICELPFIIQK